MGTRTLVVLAVAVVALAGAAFVTAQSPDEGEGNQTAADEESRSVEVDSPEGTVELVLTREDGDDPIRVGFEPPNATLTTTYGGDGEETQLTVRLEALAEYRDANENGSYDFGEPIASGIPLSPTGNASSANRTQWSSPIVTNTSQGETEGQRVVVPARLVGNGTFTVELEAYGDHVRTRNASLTPTNVRVGWIVEDYPYQRDDTDLALFLAVQVPADQTGEQYSVRGERERGFLTSGASGDRSVNVIFAWRTSAQVDGDRQIVHTTQMAIAEDAETDGQEDGRRTTEEGRDNRTPAWRRGALDDVTERYVLSYERGDTIAHDGETEIAVASAEQTDGTPALGLGLALLGVGATAVLRRRRT